MIIFDDLTDNEKWFLNTCLVIERYDRLDIRPFRNFFVKLAADHDIGRNWREDVEHAFEEFQKSYREAIQGIGNLILFHPEYMSEAGWEALRPERASDPDDVPF